MGQEIQNVFEHLRSHDKKGRHSYIQYNLDGSNTDGSFTVDDSNSFFTPYKILRIAQENKYFGIFFLILSRNCMLCVLIGIASSRRF